MQWKDSGLLKFDISQVPQQCDIQTRHQDQKAVVGRLAEQLADLLKDDDQKNKVYARDEEQEQAPKWAFRYFQQKE